MEQEDEDGRVKDNKDGKKEDNVVIENSRPRDRTNAEG